MTSLAGRHLRRVFTVVSGATPKSGNADYWDGSILWATPQDISFADGYWLGDTQRKISRAGYESCGATIVPPNSVVLTKRAPIGQVAVLSESAASNQGCLLLVPRDEIDSRYYYYWLLSQTDYLQVLGRGSTFMELSADELKSLTVPYPPLRKQRAIADYLDREVTRLDALVAEKERVLALLGEKRRALIRRAVTEGLDPKAPLQESGTKWLGKLPAHWGIAPLRFLVDMTSGATPNTRRSEYWDGDIPWVSPKDMKQNAISDSRDHVSEMALSESSLRLIDAGAILIVVRGMILAHSFPVAINSVPVTINQDMKALRCREILEPQYLCAFFQAFEEHAVSLADVSAHGTRRFDTEVLGRLKIPLPPRQEQKRIVTQIDQAVGGMNALGRTVARSITLLNERREALTVAAVNDRVDVGSAG